MQIYTKTRLALGVLGAAAVAAVAGLFGAPAGAYERSTVVCTHLNGSGTGYVFRYRIRPRSCTFAETRSRGSAITGPIRWRWTARRATGRGKTRTVDGRQRVIIRLSRPARQCGGRRFTRVR